MSGINITDTFMSSPATPHTARATGDGWEVSWLPGRTLSRTQATTAMVLANVVGDRGVGLADDPIRLHLGSWAAELGLPGADAVARVSEPPIQEDPAAPDRCPERQPSGGARLSAHAGRDGKVRTGCRLAARARPRPATSRRPGREQASDERRRSLPGWRGA